jgi:hypothetical protein
MAEGVQYADPTQWMFQYNPDWYDLDASIQQRLIEPWTMYRHRDYVGIGQRIYFMQSGGQYAAVTAVGRIATPMYEKPEETDIHLRYWVDVVYDALLAQPLTRPAMLNDPILKDYPPLAIGMHGTGFRLPANVAARLEQLVTGHLRPIGASHLTQSGVAVDRRIFVSHSHEDNEFGVRLVDDLRKALGGNEATVWYDASGGLHGGEAWWRTIVAEIKARPVFIVVLSPDSMQSRWVEDEIDLAWKLKNAPGGKLIVPVLHRECDVRDDLTTRQMVSFLPPKPYDDALHELLATIGMHSVSRP